MKDIPDSSIDMILCDLPYGILNFKQDGWKNNNSHISWDNEIDIELLFKQYQRVIKRNSAIVLFCKEPLTSKIILSDMLDYSHKYIWIKNNCANAKIKNKCCCSYTEEIVVLYDKYKEIFDYDNYRNLVFRYIGKTRQEIIRVCGQSVDHFFRNKTKQFISEVGYASLITNFHIDQFPFFIDYEKLCALKKYRTFNNHNQLIKDYLIFDKDVNNFHPTQKPISLLEFLIKLYSNENDTILDNCMGSGSTGIACLNTNRNFIGIELDENYFKIAKDRIEKQEKLNRSKLF